MLRNLFLLLLAIGLVTPALAAPACGPMSASKDPVAMQGGHMGHGGHSSTPADDSAPKHECIGCIAPTHGLADIAEPAAFAALRLKAPRARAFGAHNTLPDPPPPRA